MKNPVTIAHGSVRASLTRSAWSPVAGLLTLLVLSQSCGSPLKPSASKATTNSLQGANAAGNAQGLQGVPQKFSFTANYTARPVDVIIIRDQQTRYEPFNTRILNAIPILAARLQYLGPNNQVGVFDSYFDPSATSGPTTAQPIVGGKSPTMPILGTNMTIGNLTDALVERVGMAGNRGGTYEPLSVLKAVLDEVQKGPSGQLNNFIRKGDYVAVLFLNNSIDVTDPFDVSDTDAWFTNQGGNYSGSVLAPDPSGCVITQSPFQATNPNKLPQRNLEIKFQQHTGGVFGSVCDKSYSVFFDSFATVGTGSAYFPVTLPTTAVPSSITINVQGDNTPIKEFRYVPGSKVLEISTVVTSGQKVEVDYQSQDPAAQAVVSHDPGDNVPQVKDATLPPEQLAFEQNVAPTLNAKCAGCHGPNSGRIFIVNYDSAMANKAEILRRIALATTDPQYMPMGGSLSAADTAAIQKLGQ